MLSALSWINLQNKWLVSILFAALFLCLILRAILVEPLLDELGTLFWYIQTGNILNDKAVLDANNHLLNSFVGHYSYKIFGDHLLAYRLLSIASFPIYFFSAKKLVKENIKQFQFVIFLALISIPWIFDYFSLSRGYAPSVAFFMLGLSFILDWNLSFKPKYLVIISLSFILCLLSNLSMIVPIMLIFGYLILIFLLHWKQQSVINKIQIFCISLLFLYPIYKIYFHIEKLKEAGALWWGSKNGLWEVTGKSVSENIFFTNSEIVKYGLIILFIILIFAFIYHLKKGLKTFILSIQFWSFFLLLLCLVSAVLLVLFMDVNYPQDRVAMYLVVLLILSFGSLISEIKGLKWLLISLLWFPISFVSKVNLNTTIFSPQDRIHTTFFNEIQKIVTSQDMLTADYVAHACYAYASRNSKNTKMAVLNHSDTLIGEDFRLESFYGSIKDWSNYTCILSDDITKMKLYKRIKISPQIQLKDTTIRQIESNQMYIPLISYRFDENSKISNLKVVVESKISIDKGVLSLNLIQDIADSEKTFQDYNSTLFDWYFGHKKTYAFNYSRRIAVQNLHDKTLTVYLYNPELINVNINDFQVKIYGIE